MLRVHQAKGLLDDGASSSEEDRRLLVGYLSREGLVELTGLVKAKEDLGLEASRVEAHQEHGYLLEVGLLHVLKRLQHFIITL